MIKDMQGMRISHAEVVGMAVEALKRSGYYGIDQGMHPEDWAAALVPAIEAVAVGYAEGYRYGLRDGRATAQPTAIPDPEPVKDAKPEGYGTWL